MVLEVVESTKLEHGRVRMAGSKRLNKCSVSFFFVRVSGVCGFCRAPGLGV